MKKKYAQASMEMVIAAGAVMAIFIMMLVLAYSIDNDRCSSEERISLSDECSRLSNIFSGMYLAGPGTEANITLSYNLRIESGRVISLFSDNSESSCMSPVPISNTSLTAYDMNLTDEEGHAWNSFDIPKGAVSLNSSKISIIISNIALQE